MLAFPEPHYEVVYLRYPEGFPRPVIVNADEGERRSGSSRLDDHFKGAAWFRSGRELMTDRFLDRKAGEDCKPILASLEVHEFPETMMYPQKISQGSSLVDFS